VLRLRDEGRADHVVLRVVLGSLDLEETMLDRIEDQDNRLAESEMLPVDTIQAACDHLEKSGTWTEPRTPKGCQECLRDEGRADHVVLRVVLGSLDLEETMLDRIDDQDNRLAESEMLPVDRIEAQCEHLEESGTWTEPHTPKGCEECLRDGTVWVHLRLCLECGHVGCCDSSEKKHATAHFHELEHPVIRSIEPGESWRWCYVDEVVG